MKSRIPSTVVISILVLINLYFLCVAILPLDIGALITPLPEEHDAITLLWTGIAAGVAILTFEAWALSIAITHAICLIFTVKNRKSPFKAVRIINIVLDVANVFLIVAPITKMIIWGIMY